MGVVERISNFGDYVGARVDSAVGYVNKDYAYANARVKGMKANLLSREQNEALINARSINELMGMLSNSGYREDLVVPGARYRGADLVELGVGRNLARVYRKVLKFTPEKGRETLGALLERWDVHNLKTILLAKNFGEGKERVQPLMVDVGLLGKGMLDALLELEGVDDVIEACKGTRYYKALKEGRFAHKRTGDIAVLLAKLDEFYYANLPGRIKAGHRDEQIILDLVRAEIDMKNVANILRAKKAGMDEKKVRALLLKGGEILSTELEKLVQAGDVEAVVEMLRTKYDLIESFGRYRADGSFVHFEIEMERRMIESAVRSLRTSILSIGVVASFLFLKEEEANNIRKIVRGLEFGIPKDEIREMVITIGG